MAFHPSRRKIIDDTTASSDKSYSSNKINNELQGKNLLDNPWFTINQRGFSTTTTRVDTYGFDRWRGTYRYDSTNKCSTLSDVEYLIQYLDEDLKKNLDGKTVTASILYADGTIKKGTITYRYPYTDWQTIITDTDLYCQIGYSSTSSDLLNGAFTITARNASFSIKAVKLEIGSESTLTNDIIPDYAIELAKCKASSVDSSDVCVNQGQIVTVEQWKKNGAYNLACGVFTSKVENGTTYIANSDGSVSVSGEATGSNITSSAFTLKAGTYLVGFNPIPQSGGVTTDSTNFTILDSSNNHLTGLPLNDATSKVITVAADMVVKIRLYAYANSSGHTTNTTFYPVITTDLNATVADFVSPAMTNRQLTESAIFGNLTRISNPSVTLSMADATKTVNITKPYKMYLLVLAYNGSYKSTLLFPNGLNYYIDGNPTNLNYNSTVEASVNSTNDTATIHLVQIKGWTTAVCDIYGIS